MGEGVAYAVLERAAPSHRSKDMGAEAGGVMAAYLELLSTRHGGTWRNRGTTDAAG